MGVEGGQTQHDGIICVLQTQVHKFACISFGQYQKQELSRLVSYFMKINRASHVARM